MMGGRETGLGGRQVAQLRTRREASLPSQDLLRSKQELLEDLAINQEIALQQVWGRLSKE